MSDTTGFFPSLLVDEAFVTSHQHDIVVCDVRWDIPGRSRPYEDGHLPRAVRVELEQHLTGELGGVKGRHPLPSPEALAATLGGLGIAAEANVVAYDDVGGSIAGRFVWMLRSIGQSVALLDGGLVGYGGALESGPARPRAAVGREPLDYDASYFATVEEIESLEGAVLVDARPESRYRGEGPSSDARAGHIPGAKSLPWASLLDPTTERFLDKQALRERFASLGIGEGTNFIASCGSGVTACPDLVAFEHAGLGVGRLFVPSFSGWSSDPGHEVATA